MSVQADPLARTLVSWAGLVLTLSGGAILAVSQLPVTWRVLCLVVWFMRAALAMRGFRRAYRQVSCLLIDAAGGVTVLGPGGQRTAARYLTGSFAIPALAWIRLRLPDGNRYGELFIGRRVEPLIWHRLQLAWQLGQRSFGHRGPA